MEEKWFQKSYRRNLVDMHIPDWDERFLSKFDPETYVNMLTLADVTSAIVYATSHVGNCHWPTKTGHMHEGLRGRDILREIIDLGHQRGIDVIIYYSLLFNNWVYENHPNWRIITPEGKEIKGLTSRYGVCCPNSSYRDFAVAQIEELCAGYEFEGVWFDMTYWETVCYCPACTKRYFSETGEELPRIVDWENPKWVKFQRKREEWLAEFASSMTSTVRKLKPNATVVHQSGAFEVDWQCGASVALAKANDFMSSDLSADSLQSGDYLQLTFYFKLFCTLGNNMPFEFMSSRCLSLGDHITMKPRELLEARAYLTLANNGAFLFIDAIDPVGTLDERGYDEMGKILKGVKKYEKYLGGKPCQDIGIYFSFESRINLSDNGKKVGDVISNKPYSVDRKLSPHTQAALCAAKSLLDSHIPFGVITKKNLKDLSSYQVIILPNVLMMDEEEVEALKKFVASGGSLYVSKYSSLLSKDGEKKEDFLLSDLLGVSYLGETKEEVTYISPTEEGKDIFPSHSAKYPLIIRGSQIKVKAKKGATVLATLTLPYTDPKDPTHFASIHSNPPGIPTDYPSIILNKYGKGRVMYIAAELEAVKADAHRLSFINLIKILSQNPFFFKADAPKSVEVTLFHQEDKKRYLINLFTSQFELPNIPVEAIKVRIRLDGKEPHKLMMLPEEKELAYENKGDYVEFTAPKLETFLMLALDYG